MQHEKTPESFQEEMSNQTTYLPLPTLLDAEISLYYRASYSLLYINIRFLNVLEKFLNFQNISFLFPVGGVLSTSLEVVSQSLRPQIPC